MILRLLGSQLVLLLLIFLVSLGIAGVWRCELVRLDFAGVTRRVGMTLSGIFRMIFGAGFSRSRWTRFIAPRGIRRRSFIFAARLF